MSRQVIQLEHWLALTALFFNCNYSRFVLERARILVSRSEGYSPSGKRNRQIVCG